MKAIYRVLLFSIIITSSLSCKKEKNPPLLTIDPQYLVMSVNAGEVIQLHIKASSEDAFNRLLISSKTDDQFTKTELDSVLIPSKKFNFTYEYKIPVKPSNFNLTLNFRIYDQEGNEASASRKLEVKVSSAPLQEYSGNSFYSNYSAQPDAYNLITRSPVFSEVSSAADQHVKDAHSDPGNPSNISNSWISPAGAKFVVYDGFDYVNATKTSLVNAYNSGVKLEKVINLQQDQIILSKLIKDGVERFFAVKIVQIIDEEGAENDRYIFNIKE